MLKLLLSTLDPVTTRLLQDENDVTILVSCFNAGRVYFVIIANLD